MNISLKGLDKGGVLAALYNASKPRGMGFMHYNPAPMTAEEGNELLQTQTYFDYLKGRVMKVDLGGDEFDPWLYDRDNGQGAAQRAIDAMTAGDVDAISEAHITGKAQAINDARKLVRQETKVVDGGGVLGLADVADILEPILDDVA